MGTGQYCRLTYWRWAGWNYTATERSVRRGMLVKETCGNGMWYPCAEAESETGLLLPCEATTNSHQDRYSDHENTQHGREKLNCYEFSISNGPCRRETIEEWLNAFISSWTVYEGVRWVVGFRRLWLLLWVVTWKHRDFDESRARKYHRKCPCNVKAYLSWRMRTIA